MTNLVLIMNRRVLRPLYASPCVRSPIFKTRLGDLKNKQPTHTGSFGRTAARQRRVVIQAIQAILRRVALTNPRSVQ